MVRVPVSEYDKIVVAALPCASCGYDLHGLGTTGRCPECGTTVWSSIQHRVDPDASRLPRLRNARGVGNGLFFLAVTWFIATLCLVAVPAASWLQGLDAGWAKQLGQVIPSWLDHAPGWILLLGLWSVTRFWTPRGEVEQVTVRRDLWILLVGIVVSSGTAIFLGYADPSMVTDLVLRFVETGLAFSLLAAMWALRRIVRVVGQRSRQFRSAKGGRQHIVGLMAVLVIILVGSWLRMIPESRRGDQGLVVDWAAMGSATVAAGFTMLLIGLAYFVVNMWWIRKALRNQPPPLEAIIMPAPPDRDD